MYIWCNIYLFIYLCYARHAERRAQPKAADCTNLVNVLA
jgi:hypothetical protein